MSKYIRKTMLGLGLLSGLFMVSCDDVDPVLESIDFDGLFAPIGITANLNKIVELNLSWTAVKGADRYVVEIYKDSLKFEPANLVKTMDVESPKLTYILDGDTRYSSRIMAKGAEIKDSKWNGITFATEIKSIFLDQKIGDVSSDYGVLRWTAGELATQVTLTPAKGNTITKQLTEAEVKAGVVKIEGLAPATTYTAILYSGTRRVGKSTLVTFAEGIIAVSPEDDLLKILDAAKDGDSFLLAPGEYLKDGSKISITKNISISGYNANEKPILHAQLDLAEINKLDLKYLVLDGSNSTSTLLDHALQFSAAEVYGSVTVEGCEITNYNKSLISSGSLAVSIESVTINNSVVSNILTSGADCIDIRSGVLKNLKLTNSTFNNCAPARDFIRLDDASKAYPDLVSNVLIDQCTLYKVSNDKSRRILYVRFSKNVLTVKNTIIAETAGYYTNQANSAQPECSKNNYFNASGFLPESAINATAKYDISGTHTTLDPEFSDVSQGNFKISNETLKTKKIGDPRWW